MRPKGKHRNRNQLSFVLIFWVIGIVLCTVLVGLLKYYGIYDHVSWFKVMSIPLYGFVILPGICAIIVIPLQQLERWLTNRQKHKILNKATIRKRRLAKVFRLYALWWGLLLIICCPVSLALAVYIVRLYVPEYNPDEDLLITMPLVLVVLIISMLLIGFLYTVIYARLFIRKKGTLKAMKYLCEWKKPPGILKTVWLRACGINHQDIQEYLQLNKQQR